MRRPPFLRLVLAALATLAPPSPALAQEPSEFERWIPALSVSFDAIGQPSGGAVRSGRITGPPISEGGCEVRPGSGQRVPGPCQEPVPSQVVLTPNVSGSDTAAAVLVGLSAELTTPQLLPAPGRPRLFAHGDGSLVFSSKRKLAGDGDPGLMEVPRAPSGSTATVVVSEDTISGQGNRAFSELKTPLLAAGGGVSFTIDVAGRRLRLKPSFEYLMQETEFIGLARRAVQLAGSNNARPQGIHHYRLLSFSASKTRVDHAIGGGLEIEVDSQRLGPFLLSVFANGRIYEVLGDLDLTLHSDRNEAGPSYPGENVTWDFEPESRLWRGGVGLRFRYLPK